MLKFEKERDFGGIGIDSMSDNYIAPENSFQPWRICSVETSLAYVIILTFSWNLQYSGNSRYGQEPFPSSGVRQIENRNLRASGSSRWLFRISGCFESAPIRHFRGPSSKNPYFQNEARCTIFLVKMSFISIADHLPSFWNRGPGELGNSLLSLLPLLVFRFLVALLTHPSSLLFFNFTSFR